MDAVTFTELIRAVNDTGICLVLLIVFVIYILKKAKTDDKRVADAQDESRRVMAQTYEDAQKKIDEANRAIREREDLLIEGSARREEMLREESAKREEVIRRECEKRESILMLNMERMTESMESITKSLNDINRSFSGIDRRLEKIEERVGTLDECGAGIGAQGSARGRNREAV